MTTRASLEERLQAFQADFPPRVIAVAGRLWHYIVTGPRTGPPILLLGGVLGRTEFAFEQIGLLARDCFVVAPDYPAVDSLAELTLGLLALLDREGVRRAHVVGGSFGGFMAQALLVRAPERVASLVLSHTGAPDGRRHRVGWITLIPGPVLRGLLRVRLGRTLRAADPFWRDHFDRVVSSLDRADIASRVRLQAEFGALPTAPPSWAGPVLLLAAADDPLLGLAAQATLATRFPGAERHVFAGTGHAAALLQPEAYANEVLTFVRRQAAVQRGAAPDGQTT
jgi:pimeloyl-ACP methyl ester carboxylesterase